MSLEIGDLLFQGWRANWQGGLNYFRRCHPQEQNSTYLVLPPQSASGSRRLPCSRAEDDLHWTVPVVGGNPDSQFLFVSPVRELSDSSRVTMEGRGPAGTQFVLVYFCALLLSDCRVWG